MAKENLVEELFDQISEEKRVATMQIIGGKQVLRRGNNWQFCRVMGKFEA